MRYGLPGSILLHALIAVIGYFGLPELSRDVMMESPVMVEIVMVSDVTNAPAPEVTKKPEPEPKEKAEQAKPEPEPEPKEAPPPQEAKAEPVAPPPPPPAPAPEPEIAVVVPAPEPRPKAKVVPKEKPTPEPEAKPKEPEKPVSSAVLTQARPNKKPKPPKPVDAFASVLKTVEQLKSQPKVEEKPKEADKKKEPPKETFDELIAKALVSNKRTFDTSRPLSISEIDLVRQQIGQCWSLPAGAKGAENMNIEIAVNMNPDGTVRDARVNNKGLDADPFLRTMAESALRAVLNDRCQPFKLPHDKYDRWKTMTLIFNPKEMFGG